MSEQTSTVFGTQPATPAGTSVGGEPDPVTLLVGEGKKFKTVQDLAKGKMESDTFISQLTQENKTLREAIANGSDTAGIEAKIEQLLAAQRGSGPTNSQPSNQSQPASLTAENVLDLLDKRDKAKALENNSSFFNSTISKVLGPEAKNVVLKRIEDLGMDLETFNTFVARNPQSALKLVGVKETSNPVQGDVTGKGTTVNTAAAFNPEHNGDQVQNQTYFNKLRKTMGNKFFTPEMNSAMMEARKKLGADYFK